VQRVLIIGGAGFIGYHLATKLKNNFKIDIIDDLSRGKFDNDFKELLKNKNVKFFKRDLLANAATRFNTTKNYKYIFHLAAIVGVKNVLNHPFGVLSDNIELLKKAINIASKQIKLKRLIFCSSSEVYFGTLKNYGLNFPTKEETKLSLLDLKNKRGTYMLSKIYGEAMCVQSGLPFTIIRPHNFFGPRMGLSHVIPELLKKTYTSKNKKISVFSPKHKRNFCYIDDGVNLILSLVFDKRSLRRTFNVGSNAKDITIEKLANIIIKISKKKLKIKMKKDVFESPSRRLPDVSKALKITSYKYNYNLIDGLIETLEWYKKNIFKKKITFNK